MEPGEAVLPSPAPTSEAVEEAALVLQLEDGELTLFEAAIGAFNAGEFERAESLFLEEAERTLPDSPQRAAIAFREAALAARRAGNLDGSDHWMRLAGREYLRVSEDPRTPLPFIREAAVMAAKCFLSVENLHIASKGLRRAQAIESVLSTDEDLMAGSIGSRQTPAPPPIPVGAPPSEVRPAARSRIPGAEGRGRVDPEAQQGISDRPLPGAEEGAARSGDPGSGEGGEGTAYRDEPGRGRASLRRGRSVIARRRRPGLPRRR